MFRRSIGRLSRTFSSFEPKYIFFLTRYYKGSGNDSEYRLFYIDIDRSNGYDKFINCNDTNEVKSVITDLNSNENYEISNSVGHKINLFKLFYEDYRNLIAMFFIKDIAKFKIEISSTKIIVGGWTIKGIISIIQQNEIVFEQIVISYIKPITLIFRKALDEQSRISKGGNKYNKYTLNDLKQIAIDNKIKITKMVVISNDELHKKLKDKNIIINKKIKLEDFKRILIENNIKITKRVNLTKQELIKKLEI